MFAKVKPNTQIIGQNIIYFNRVNSTNSFALELMKQDMASDGTVIIAEYQGNGRGQGDKQWVSDAYENLLFTIVLKPVTNKGSDPFSINKAIALSVQNCVKKLLPGEEVYIKWPNDILVNKKKICGILVENNFSGQKLNWSLAGIGLNVNQDFSSDATLNAASLKSFFGSEIQRNELLKKLLEETDRQYHKILEGNSDAINVEFDSQLLGYQQNQRFVSDGIEFTSKVAGCDSDGRLITEDENGLKKTWLHGKIKQVIND